MPVAGSRTLLSRPTIETGVVLLAQSFAARSEQLCSRKPVADVGQEMVTLPPEAAIFICGKAGAGAGQAVKLRQQPPESSLTNCATVVLVMGPDGRIAPSGLTP